MTPTTPTSKTAQELKELRDIPYDEYGNGKCDGIIFIKNELKEKADKLSILDFLIWSKKLIQEIDDVENAQNK